MDYSKYKKNNLPTPVWNKEKDIMEYVCYEEDQLKISYNLSFPLEHITWSSLYFPFTSKHVVGWLENNKLVEKLEIGHMHEHDFESVVKALYSSPESFSISKKEEEFYSKQELKYLKRIQKYLLFIGLKDIDKPTPSITRYRNKLYEKYKDISIYRLDNKLIDKIKRNKISYLVQKYDPKYIKNDPFKEGRDCSLIVNNQDDFKLLIEYTEQQVKSYEVIKNQYEIEGLTNKDKVIVTYFKILENYDEKDK